MNAHTIQRLNRAVNVRREPRQRRAPIDALNARLPDDEIELLPRERWGNELGLPALSASSSFERSS